MITERYVISFYGIDTKYYTDEYVGRCWEIAADAVYRERQIYVTGSVTTTSIICGEIRGCNLGKTGHVIISVRNPAEVHDREQYRSALKQVLLETRTMLENPNMSVVVDEVEYYYFCQV
ncbi:MAG: hypothetical protein KH230_24540 [Enterocloster asparagiformis]|nr:hypothetical protein [Enterocloster asparagiformis]